MGDIKIITNHQPRFTLDWYELTPAEQKWFDYRKPDDGAEFVRYKGNCYDLSDMELAVPTLQKLGWDGQVADGYFSGVVFRWEREEWHKNALTGRVICGIYLA